ncbi:hypothetical protein SAY87_017472 [Trapa incisa]|uniref:BAG family molecular chaperone regulator 1 n=1 Tax=Trapa incisa TaxID=236973 RepID=A0AAN7L2H9_9MYRT|nr:hypothetical protein SAY87_017472 [Trapa incisa]
MMRTEARIGGGLDGSGSGSSSGGVKSESEGEWEMRPGGMLVQKRNPDLDPRAPPPPPVIRVRVKHGSIYHEISISSAATFGDLKKLLMGPTGLHYQDQKLIYKKKERESTAFLDTVGIKDRSKIILVGDLISQEKRLLEMRRNAKMDKASKCISEVSSEVDRLASKVAALDSIISNGGKVAETDVLNLIELLMTQLLRLDGVIADGDMKLQRKMQVRRIQKYVETLDMLKVKNSVPSTRQAHHSNGLKLATDPPEQSRQVNGHSQIHHQQQQKPPLTKQAYEEHKPRHSTQPTTARTVVTTEWETFDSTTTTSGPAINNNNPFQPIFNWELFK